MALGSADWIVVVSRRAAQPKKKPCHITLNTNLQPTLAPEPLFSYSLFISSAFVPTDAKFTALAPPHLKLVSRLKGGLVISIRLAVVRNRYLTPTFRVGSNSPPSPEEERKKKKITGQKP